MAQCLYGLATLVLLFRCSVFKISQIYGIINCFIAGFIDETPREYYCNTGADGRRRDSDERPELCRGTVEFVATKEYMVRNATDA